MMKLYPTPHAIQRAKERAGLCRQSLERMLERIYYDGLFPDACPSRLRDYLDSASTTGESRRACVYGEHVYVFGSNPEPDVLSLITVLQLPGDLRSLAHKARARHLQHAA